MKAALIVKNLVDTHKNNFDLLMSEVSLPKSFTHHDLVTLASVVEKETGASHERANNRHQSFGIDLEKK